MRHGKATRRKRDRDRLKLCSGIIFRAFLGGATGLSAEAAGELLSIPDSIPVELRPLNRLPEDAAMPAQLRHRIARSRTVRLPEHESLYFQACAPPDFDLMTCARIRVGRATFETDRLPEGWADRCLQMDEVWVSSTFNAEVFAASGVPSERIRILPIGIHAGVFRPGVAPASLPHARGFCFISVFDWHERKAPELLLEAFVREFGKNEDVCLLLKVSQNVDRSFSIEDRLIYFIERDLNCRIEDIPPIILLRGALSEDEMAALYVAADCFVLPSRGEGWGIPYMEALACETPVIATRWSGQLDFLHDDNSDLIEIDGVIPVAADTNHEVFAGQCWAQPSLEHLRQLMRQAAEHPDRGRRKAQQGRQEILQRWDWKHVGRLWTEAFLQFLEV